MCQGCWNVDEKIAGSKCDKSEWPVYTLNQLKKKLVTEYEATQKTSYKVYSGAIAEKPRGSLNWDFGSITLRATFL